MLKQLKKPVSILLSLIMIVSLFTIVPLSASAAYWYSDLARGTLIQPGDTFSFEEIGSFKFADYNDPTIIHEVKGSDFSYNQATLSVTDGYYSFGSTKLLPTSVSPGGLLIADYDSTTKMATFGVQNITHSFDSTTGTLTIGGTGVVPRNYAFTGSDVYGVVFTQSNLVKHLIIDATDMIAIKQNAFMAYTGGCVLEDVEINSTSSTPLIIEEDAVFYEKDSAVTITVNAAKLATVTSCPVGNYSSPVNLIYNVQEPITFNRRVLSSFDNSTVTIPTGSKVYIPAAPQFTDSDLQTEYNQLAQYGDDWCFWDMHSDLVEGTDYVMGEASYETLTPENVSLVVGDNTAYFTTYAVTDASVNGAVTASVGGTDVTEAEPDSTVLLTVAPDSGYQFKSITAIGAKYSVEEFSDLVALMGDAVFEAAEYADHTEHTCKAEDGKFVVYNGTTPVTELSESDITDVSGLSGNSPMITCGNIRWYFGVSNGKITSIEAVDTSSWDYLFESANGSESTGTLPPADFALTTVTEGSQYSFTMPKRAVTVTAEFEEAAPATYTVTWKNGNNVIEEDTGVESGAAPSYGGATPTKAEDADNTYEFSGWYDGTTTYGLSDTLPNVTADVTYTAQFTAVPKPAPTSGSFDGLTWNIDDEGTLTFSGSGAIPMNAFKQNEDIKKVIINDSVTELGSYAFKECPNLTEVEIQNPSVSLSDTSHQFDYCESLTTVTLPEGMTLIPQGMFRDCTALTTVDLPSTITTIEDMAFMDSGLQSISVPEGATYQYGSFLTFSLTSLTLEGRSPMTFAGGELNYLTDEATVYIPEGSKYVYSTTTATLYVKDPSNDMAQDILEYAQEDFNRYIEYDYSPEKALAKVNDLYSWLGNDPFGMNVTTEGPFTVELKEGDKCAAVFGGATIGKYVPPTPIILDNPLGTAPIIGFQKKAATGNLTGNNIDTQGVRIITKVEDVDLTQFDEYGYVVAKVSGKQQATANFNNLKAYGGNGEKTIKCNGTVNTIDGYGTPYVTLAVNGMNDGDQVAARFYAIKDGVTYYSNYVSTARYNGILATY